MSRILISPHHTLDEFSNVDLSKFETRVMLYEDRITGWLLEPTRALLGTRSGDFAALSLVLTYFESVEIFRSGESSEGRSGEFFRRGLLDVFRGPVTANRPDIGVPSNFKEKLADVLYKQARCGLFHQGATGYRIAIEQGQAPIDVEVDIEGVGPSPTHWRTVLVKIDPVRWLSQVEGRFSQYVEDLQEATNVDLRDRFMRAWDLVHQPK